MADRKAAACFSATLIKHVPAGQQALLTFNFLTAHTLSLTATISHHDPTHSIDPFWPLCPQVQLGEGMEPLPSHGQIAQESDYVWGWMFERRARQVSVRVVMPQF